MNAFIAWAGVLVVALVIAYFGNRKNKKGG